MIPWMVSLDPGALDAVREERLPAMTILASKSAFSSHWTAFESCPFVSARILPMGSPFLPLSSPLCW